MKKFKLNKKIYFIAEIGINHEGSEKICKKMMLEAKKSGADAAKIQIVNSNDSYDKNTQSYKEFKKRTLNSMNPKTNQISKKFISIKFLHLIYPFFLTDVST